MCLFSCNSKTNQKELNISPKNVILIVADDQGMQMGNLCTPGVLTPTMDSLAKNGILFQKAYATFSSCSPSRASFLTSTFPHVNGVTTNVWEYIGANPPKSFFAKGDSLNTTFKVKDNIVSLIESLQSAGYYTGLTGKFHMSPQYKFPFDYWGKEVDAKEFLNKAMASGKPFFLDFNMHTPHRPYAKSPYSQKKMDLNTLDIPRFLPNNKIMQEDWKNYLGAVEATDYTLGKLLRSLREKGLDKNTLIIYISDHGPSTHRGKYSAYPFGSQVPVIFSGPDIVKNMKSNSLVSLIDLMPTILDYLKIKKPKTAQGRSLINIVTGKDFSSVNNYIYTEVSFPRKGETNFQARGMSDGRFWYIRRNKKPRMRGKPEDNYDEKVWRNLSYKATLKGKKNFPLQYDLLETFENNPPLEELFDLYSDPWTLHDISKNPEFTSVILRMRNEMNSWIKKTNDKEMMSTAKY
ncbi:hypothetical protein GCM10022260_17190 [Gaetbulibacter aestuarii]